MTDSRPSKVFMFDGADPEMRHASELARANFRYFWRELSWEQRRIIPALDLACVKAPFTDGDRALDSNDPRCEHMWLNEIEFDGKVVSGVLLNKPNWLKTVRQGSRARISLSRISDWMYGTSEAVFGAYTVNLLRSRMGTRERREHDAAWGLNFGDPRTVRVAPEPEKAGGLVKRWFGKQEPATDEHPMSLAMAPKYKEQFAADPSLLNSKDERGWTLLHMDALAGNAPIVKVLLEAGADPRAVTNDGRTPMQLAQVLGWEKVIALLGQEN